MSVELVEGQTWRHKRESWRTVIITGIREGRDRHGALHTYVYVSRNTSRRTQAIREDTLRRDYSPTNRRS